MILRIVSGFILTLITTVCLGQSDTTYLYKLFSVEDKSEADRYQIITYCSVDSLEAFETNYYMDHSISSRRFYKDYPNKVIEGKTMFWNKAGWVESIMRYDNGTLHGESLIMDSLGRLDIRLHYNRGELYYWERKQEDGAFLKQDTPYETMPVFPGCEALTNERDRRDCTGNAMYKFVVDNLKYPALSRDNGISGTVYVTYYVDVSGWIKEINVLKMIDGDEHLAKAALDAVLTLPQFIPGTRAGEIVESPFTIPLRFKIR